MSGGDTTDSATNALNSDARPAFVTPRDLLQQSRAPCAPKEPPRQLSAIDREQLDGLVRQGLIANGNRIQLTMRVENNQSFPQGQDEL
jgi:hypothetical protein